MSLRPDHENPSEAKKTSADRMSEAPSGLWFILAIIFLIVVVAAVLLIGRGRLWF